jgi:cell division protein FtsQ
MDGRRRLYQQITARAGQVQDRPARRHRESVLHGALLGSHRAGLWGARLLTIAVLGAGIGLGLVEGGHVVSGAQIADRLGRLAGLEIKRIKVDGSRHLDQAQLVALLELRPGATMLSFDAARARARLERTNWIAKAQVLKLYPGQILVKIRERQPFVRWQIDGRYKVVDRTGIVLIPLKAVDYPQLSLVVGKGAGKRAARLFRLLKAHPEVARRVKTAIRVADRRWNLRLVNAVTVKLPEHDPGGALARLAELDRRHQLLSRRVEIVDLRVKSRISLRTAPEEQKPVPQAGQS